MLHTVNTLSLNVKPLFSLIYKENPACRAAGGISFCNVTSYKAYTPIWKMPMVIPYSTMGNTTRAMSFRPKPQVIRSFMVISPVP